MTPDDVAFKLNVSRKVVHDWLRSGALVGLKLGKRLWRIKQTDLESFLQSRNQTFNR